MYFANFLLSLPLYQLPHTAPLTANYFSYPLRKQDLFYTQVNLLVCLTNDATGKRQKGYSSEAHLQDVQIRIEPRYLATLSEMMTVIFFYLMQFTRSTWTLFPISRHFHTAHLQGM